MGLNKAAEGISKGLEVGAFFVQFLQWWQVKEIYYERVRLPSK